MTLFLSAAAWFAALIYALMAAVGAFLAFLVNLLIFLIIGAAGIAVWKIFTGKKD